MTPEVDQASELAEKLKLLAENDPVQAAAAIAQLVTAIDEATGGKLTGGADLGSPNQ
jgi:hypothetical protein